LRARGELLELRAHDLCFTVEEADALLNARLGLDLTREDVELLFERTEGWAAGLYLAALSLAGVVDRHARIGRFDAKHSYVADFLTEEVLDASDPATRQLMLRCSVFERFCGDLCDVLLETEGSAETLDALSRTNLFLVSLDDRGEWFRFHHLFGELLQMELERREPGSAAALHRRASEWHRRHGTTHEAIHHALAAGDFAEAGELIEAAWRRYGNAGRYATVLGWLLRLPEELVSGNARLLLVKVWALSMSGRADEARSLVPAIEQLGGLEKGPLADGSSSVEASLALWNACFGEDDVGVRLKNARRAAELEGPGTPFRSGALWSVAYGLYLSGESEQARPWFEEAAEQALASGDWLTAGSSLAHLSLIAGERGELERQCELAEQAVAVTGEGGNQEISSEVPLAYAASPEACRTLAEAEPYLERGVAGFRAYGIQGINLAYRLYLESVVLRRFGEHKRAAASIAEAESILESCPDPGALPAWLAALKRPPHSRVPRRSEALSQRELTVLRLLGGTLTERDIGRELYLSHNTVHSHVQSIFRKLDVSSRNEALDRARELHYL
jgi:LuxR family transcriptional regulator, maltose regulon positive regulatory protein